MSYAPRAARTLTDAEARRLLRATGAHSDTYRDHVLVALALGTGLRLHELCALDVGDVRTRAGGARQRVQLRVFKRCSANPAPQVVTVPDGVRKKLDRFMRWKQRRGEDLDPCSPLFVSRHHRRLSTRRAREVFSHWRDELELTPGLTFHALRHTFCQQLYETTGDIRIVQRAARHANLQTTTIYAEPSEEALTRAVQGVIC